MKFTCIDCFAGAGGLSLGLSAAGYTSLLAFDNDPRCIETQRANPVYFKHPILQADVEELLNGKVLKLAKIKRGQLFLLAGGPPCQGFSVQRIGNDIDTRNDLVDKYFSLVDDIFPAYFLMENVAGITGKRGRLILEKSIHKAEALGYQVSLACLDAQDYGVPQRRKRVFIFGDRLPGPKFMFPTPTTPEGNRITVRQAIGSLPEPPEDGSDHPELHYHRRDRLSAINIERLKALGPGEGRDNLPEELLANCHKRDSSKIGHRNVYGRMSWDDVAPTITARFDSFTRGLFGHPEQIRSISLLEGALLQTFPIDFIFSGNKVDIARQIGNAVPPRMGEIIGKQIIKHHRNKKLGRDYHEF